MDKTILTKTFWFAAAHYIPGHPECGAVHGHNYKLEVRVKGEINPETGMVMDFSDLGSIVKEHVIEKLDHSDLNKRFEIPTAENIAVWIYNVLKQELPDTYQVRLWETEKNSVIYPPE